METQKSPFSDITTKFNLILQEELAAAKKRRPELKDAQWLDDDDILCLRLTEPGRGYITALVAYIAVIDQQTGGIRSASIKFGWRPPAKRIGYEARIQGFLDGFADALRDGTIPPLKSGDALGPTTT